jgi:8-oxo-dGTP diphosphatase
MKLATLCYIQKDNKTLMLYRNKKENDYHEGKWNGLGGKGFITFPLFDGKDDWHVFLFVINDFEGELIDSPEGELEWIPNEKLTEINLWDGDKIFIPWLFEDKFFSAKFVYEEGKFKNYEVNFY